MKSIILISLLLIGCGVQPGEPTGVKQRCIQDCRAEGFSPGEDKFDSCLEDCLDGYR